MRQLVSNKEYGILTCTKGERIIGNTLYDYNDKLIIDENGRLWLYWQGQKKHGRDTIAIDQHREMYVCTRSHETKYFTFLGIMINDTISMVDFGDKTEGIPALYKFQIRTWDLPIEANTLLSGKYTKAVQAVDSLGFFYKHTCQGINIMWPKLKKPKPKSKKHQRK